MRRARELGELPSWWLSGRKVAPPRRLRVRTGAVDLRSWESGGRAAAAELAVALDQPLSGFRSILDFGCGSGRVLPHVAACAPDAVCTGCDVDAEAIAWARAHHPGLRFAISGAEPPLPFPDHAFELVYSISVFSHLDSTLQDLWLAEIVRVLAPGGTALLTVHGPSAFEAFRTGAVRTSWCPPAAFARGPLAEGGFMFAPYRRSRWNRADLPGVGEGYGLAFHGPDFVRAFWGRWFEVERIVPRALTDWQDAVVLRRRRG